MAKKHPPAPPPPFIVYWFPTGFNNSAHSHTEAWSPFMRQEQPRVHRVLPVFVRFLQGNWLCSGCPPGAADGPWEFCLLEILKRVRTE